MLMYVHAVILGLVEGITEFLPISSTGHLILASSLLKIPDTTFQKSFEIIIQLGAILAVFGLYWKRLLLNMEVLKRVIVGFIPTAIIGLILYKIVKHYLLGNMWVVVVSLFVGGIILYVFETFHKESVNATDDIARMSYRQCLIIGGVQAIAMVPGVSRSAATIVGGLLVGLKRQAIIEYSFLLAIPTMAAASALDLFKNASLFSSDQFGTLAVGFVVSALTAFVAVRWLLRYVSRHDFKVFGVYRIAIAVLFAILLVSHIL